MEKCMSIPEGQTVRAENTDPQCSVDMRKEKPFHCSVCGDGYEACCHWFPEDLENAEED